MPARFDVLQPSSLSEACSLLKETKGWVLPHAGGTDVMVMLRNADSVPDYLLDLNRVNELNYVTEGSDGTLRIGARATMTALIAHPIVNERFTALCDAMKLVGSVQIRNRATLAGNATTASPAGDTLPALAIFDARVNVVSATTRRTLSILDYVTGPKSSARKRDELIESIEIPKPSSARGSAYLRATRRRAVDLAIVGVALSVDGVDDVRVSYCAVGPRPILGLKAENALRNADPDDPQLIKTCAVCAEEIAPIDDVRAGADYRVAMTAVYLARSYRLAWKRLKGTLAA